MAEITFGKTATPPILEIRLKDESGGCRIMPDGTFQTFGDYKPCEVAKEFWDFVEKYAKAYLKNGK